MKVVLIRHFESEPRSGDRQDDYRSLTVVGRKEARKLGKGLRLAGEDWALIITSPLVRAVQSAEIVAARMKFKGPVEVAEVLTPGRGTWEDYRALATSFPAIGTVAMFGHDPSFGAAAGEALGRQPIEFPKGAALGLELAADGSVAAVGFFDCKDGNWIPIPPVAPKAGRKRKPARAIKAT